MRRRRRLWRIVLGVLLSLFTALVVAAWPGCTTYTIGPETTYVTGPLDKHGYIDYPTALNQRLRGNITPETNANVLIWQALGPHPEGGTMPAEYFQWLGIEQPPEEGEYLVSWPNYLKERLKEEFARRREEFDERLSRAGKAPWSAQDEPELADWLKRNEKPLSKVIEATGRTEYYNPLVPKRSPDWSEGLLKAPLANVQQCREVAKALTCRAMLRVNDGKIDDAWQDLIACHRLGRLIWRSGCIIELLVAAAIEKLVAKTEMTLLERANLTSKLVSVYWRDIQSLAPMPPLADKIDLNERFTMLDVMMSVAEHGTPFLDALASDRAFRPSHRFMDRLFTRSINWDPALRNTNRWLDRVVAAFRIPDRNERQHELTEIVIDIKELKYQVANISDLDKSLMNSTQRGEFIGNVLIVHTLPAYHKMQGPIDRSEQSQRNLHVAYALAAFRAEHSRYPATLDELSPKYLDKIPDDLFAGKPLIYRPDGNGYVLSSLGLNGFLDSD